MSRVLFVCGSNVGRSQVAEAFFNAYSKSGSAWSCAGNDFIGGEIQEDVAKMMKDDFGIDMSKQRPKPFNWNMVKQSDKLVILCSASECPSIRGADHWSIPNMGKLSSEGKQEVIKLIQSRVRGLVKKLDSNRVK